MADKNQKQKSKKNQSNGKQPKKLDIAVRGIADNLVFSKRDVWAFYRSAPKMFEFSPTGMLISDALKTSTGLTNLVEGRTDPLDTIFITTSTPIDIAAWRSQVHAVLEDWQTPEAMAEYFDEMTDYVGNQHYTNRVGYVGIHLGRRGAVNFSAMNPLESGVRGAGEAIKDWFAGFTETHDEAFTEREERDFRSREDKVRSSLMSSGIISGAVSAEELMLVIKRQFYPAMPTPYLDVDHGERIGAGDIALETACVFKNHYRYLEINQLIDSTEYTGYRAVMSLTKFPREQIYPNPRPIFYVPSLALQMPITTYARVKLLPRDKVRKEVEKRRKEQADQIKNMHASDQSYADSVVSDSSKSEQDIQDLRDLDAITQQDRSPWVQGSYRVVLEAPDPKILLNMASILKQEYALMGITSVVSAGDQEQLFLEQMPGDSMRVKSFNQVTNIHQLSTTGFNIASDAGDPIEI